MHDQIDIRSKPTRRVDNARWRKVRGLDQLYRVEDGTSFTLNHVATLIWELCDGTHSIAQIVRAISRTCGVHSPDTSVIATDTIDMLRRLAHEGLIEVKAGARST